MQQLARCQLGLIGDATDGRGQGQELKRTAVCVAGGGVMLVKGLKVSTMRRSGCSVRRWRQPFRDAMGSAAGRTFFMPREGRRSHGGTWRFGKAGGEWEVSSVVGGVVAVGGDGR